jgi:hypothetical protein
METAGPRASHKRAVFEIGDSNEDDSDEDDKVKPSYGRDYSDSDDGEASSFIQQKMERAHEKAKTTMKPRVGSQKKDAKPRKPKAVNKFGGGDSPVEIVSKSSSSASASAAASASGFDEVGQNWPMMMKDLISQAAAPPPPPPAAAASFVAAEPPACLQTPEDIFRWQENNLKIAMAMNQVPTL